MSIDTSKGHPAMDYPQHVATYEAFLKGTKIAVVLLVILLSGMAIFLT